MLLEQESIDELKIMITQLLKNQKKGSKPNTYFSKNKGKYKQGERLSFEKTKSENNSNSESLNSSSKEEVVQKIEAVTLRG